MKIPTIESAIDEALEDAWAARRRIKAALIQERRVAGRNRSEAKRDIIEYKNRTQQQIFKHLARAASFENKAEASQARLDEVDYAIRRLLEDKRTVGTDPIVREHIKLYRWTIHGAEDYLCLQYRGTVWREGTGPIPEESTHPNCRCTRDPIRVKKGSLDSYIHDNRAAGTAPAGGASSSGGRGGSAPRETTSPRRGSVRTSPPSTRTRPRGGTRLENIDDTTHNSKQYIHDDMTYGMTVFPWIGPYGLTPDTIENRHLYMAVLGREGTLHTGHVQTADEMHQQAGALRAIARSGNAILDLQHATSPDHPRVSELRNKYPAQLGTGNLHDVGRVIDAQPVLVNGKVELQALLHVDHPGVRELIDQKKILHNSTTNLFRECVGIDDSKQKCELRGSTIVRNSLLVDADGNDDHTSIRRITASDLDTVIGREPLQNSYPVADIFKERKNKLEDFRNESNKKEWKNPQSAKDYLVREKGMDIDTASRVGTYIQKNPGLFTDSQLEEYTSSEIVRIATDHKMSIVLEKEVGPLHDKSDEPDKEKATPQTEAPETEQTDAGTATVTPAAGTDTPPDTPAEATPPPVSATHTDTAPPQVEIQNESRISHLNNRIPEIGRALYQAQTRTAHSNRQAHTLMPRYMSWAANWKT